MTVCSAALAGTGKCWQVVLAVTYTFHANRQHSALCGNLSVHSAEVLQTYLTAPDTVVTGHAVHTPSQLTQPPPRR